MACMCVGGWVELSLVRCRLCIRWSPAGQMVLVGRWVNNDVSPQRSNYLSLHGLHGCMPACARMWGQSVRAHGHRHIRTVTIRDVYLDWRWAEMHDATWTQCRHGNANNQVGFSCLIQSNINVAYGDCVTHPKMIPNESHCGKLVWQNNLCCSCGNHPLSTRKRPLRQHDVTVKTALKELLWAVICSQ